MGDFKVDTGDGKYKIAQKPREIIEGLKAGGDLSRVSAYGEGSAVDKGLHTGSNSETVGRKGKEFGKKD